RTSKSQPGSRSQSPSRNYYSNIGLAKPTSNIRTPHSVTRRETSPAAYRAPTSSRPVYERRLTSPSCARSTASAKRTPARQLSHGDEHEIAHSLMAFVTPRKKYNADE